MEHHNDFLALDLNCAELRFGSKSGLPHTYEVPFPIIGEFLRNYLDHLKRIIFPTDKRPVCKFIA